VLFFTANYYLTDVLESVVAITDSSGNVKNRYSYDPYGGVVGKPTEQVPNIFRYIGGVWDSQTGLYKLGGVDRFNHWLSVDPTNGDVNVSFYDTRNDTTGFRFQTDQYLSQSTDGGVTIAPNVRVSTVSSNEHDCNGLFPRPGIDYGNQYGDYEGLVSFAGVSHPIWTDSRDQLNPSTGCKTDLAMEEVFSATVK